MQMEMYQINALLTDAMVLAVKKTAIELGHMEAYISQNKAYKKYGEAKVRQWVREGIVEKIKMGENTSTVKYERIQLETALHAYDLSKTVFI